MKIGGDSGAVRQVSDIGQGFGRASSTAAFAWPVREFVKREKFLQSIVVAKTLLKMDARVKPGLDHLEDSRCPTANELHFKTRVDLEDLVAARGKRDNIA